MIERTVHLLQFRVYDPQRAVEVERDGRWTPALQRSWQLWDDGRGWIAEVEWTERHPWGIRTVVSAVPAERVRLAEDAPDRAGRSQPEEWWAGRHLTAMSA